MSRFEGEAFTITHSGATTTVKGLSGWRCDSCGELEFDAESAHRYAAAGDELILQERVQ
jgi:HTH-type transcriptional regulator / antitoxin MqsA